MAERGAEERLRALAERTRAAVVSICPLGPDYEALPEGSGFFVGDGRVVTARHVLRGARHARVMRVGGEVHEVLGVLCEDRDSGLILLAVDIPDGAAPSLRVAPAPPSEGERVAVVGGKMSRERDGVEGAVTSVRDTPFLGKLIRTTVPVTDGGSGSPLLAMDGEVVGIAVARSLDDGILTYAVPPERARTLGAQEFTRLADRAAPDARDPDRLLPGILCLLDRDWEGAMRRFRDMAEADPKDAVAWTALAECLVQQGRGQEAADAARRAASLSPEDPRAWSALGVAASLVGRHADAVDACRQGVRLDPSDARSHNRLGVALYNLGRYPEAVEAFHEALRLNPGDAQEHKNLGVAYFGMGRFQDAVEAYQEAVRLNPQFSRAYKNLGIAYFRLGQYEKAADATKEAIRLQPDFARAHNNLGAAYQTLGRVKDAVDAYRQAVRLKPSFAQAWSNLAAAMLKLGKPDDALAVFREGVEACPGDAELRAGLGLFLRKLDRRDEAAVALEAAVRTDARHAAAQYGLGLLRAEGGDKGGALECYKALKDLDVDRANRLFSLIYK
jgi:tetratricopeptide (TPR) repeat protein